MPIFEYICDDCGARFEKLVRRSEEGIACPSCGQSHLTTTLSTFAAHSGKPSGKSSMSDFPSCPGGMCRTPDICGRN